MGDHAADGGVDPEERNLEVFRLWMQRAIMAPESWRLRASTAAGLLSAAAAATVAALVFNADIASGAPQWLISIAAIGYFVAVTALLIASVWPSPQGKLEPEDIWDYLRAEARPIKWSIGIGMVFAVVAISATTASLALAPRRGKAEFRSAHVVFVNPALNAAYEGACKVTGSETRAEVGIEENGMLRVRIRPPACDVPVELLSSSNDLIVVFDD